MQDRERDTDVYNGLLDSEGEGEGGMIWENDILTCILSWEMLWGGKWEGGSCLGTHVRIKDFKVKKINK